jgi:hypothetical protein
LHSEYYPSKSLTIFIEAFPELDYRKQELLILNIGHSTPIIGGAVFHIFFEGVNANPKNMLMLSSCKTQMLSSTFNSICYKGFRGVM